MSVDLVCRRGVKNTDSKLEGLRGRVTVLETEMEALKVAYAASEGECALDGDCPCHGP